MGTDLRCVCVCTWRGKAARLAGPRRGLDTPGDPQTHPGRASSICRPHSRSKSLVWDPVGGLSGFFCDRSPQRFLMHAGVDLQRTAPTPAPSSAQRPAQTYRLEFKDQCVKTCGAPDPKVSPSTQPSTSNPGRPQGRGHSDEKGFPGSYRNLHRLSSGSWSPAGRTGANGSLHSPAALPQHENPADTAARSTERLPVRAHFPFHGPFLSPSPPLPPLHAALVFLCSLLGMVIPGPGHTPPRRKAFRVDMEPDCLKTPKGLLSH